MSTVPDSSDDLPEEVRNLTFAVPHRIEEGGVVVWLNSAGEPASKDEAVRDAVYGDSESQIARPC